MRLELTRVGLLVELANHYTTRGAWCVLLMHLFSGFGSKHIRNAPFFFLLHAIEFTQFVGSFTFFITPIYFHFFKFSL